MILVLIISNSLLCAAMFYIILSNIIRAIKLRRELKEASKNLDIILKDIADSVPVEIIKPSSKLH